MYNNQIPNDNYRQGQMVPWLIHGLFPGLPGGGNQGGFPGYPGPGYPPQPGNPGGFPGGPGNFPGGNPGGFPGNGFPGSNPGAGGSQQIPPPNSPPPSQIPQKSGGQLKAVDPGSIQGCMFRYTYVWLKRDSFWFYPTYLGWNSVSGYRWNGYMWVYYGVDLNRIQSFQCT